MHNIILFCATPDVLAAAEAQAKRVFAYNITKKFILKTLKSYGYKQVSVFIFYLSLILHFHFIAQRFSKKRKENRMENFTFLK